MIAPKPALLLILLSLVLCQGALRAQPVTLSLRQALERVQSALPVLEAARQQSAAAKESISLARNTLVPDLTAGYQLNAATYNNITGMSYPGFLLPISGPPSADNRLNFVPGSALGALARWSPITFGQRHAAVEAATAQYNAQEADYRRQLFFYQHQAIMFYLDAVYLRQLLRTYQAAIDRNNAALEQALVLSGAGLRPGIDTAQFQSALAQGEMDLLQAEQQYKAKLVELSAGTGISQNGIDLVLTDTLFASPVVPADTSSSPESHPIYKYALAQKNATLAGLKVVQKSWMPQLDLWGNVYGRGSGIDASGGVHKSDGFRLSRTNMGAGLQLSFPVLQFSRTGIRKRQYGWLLKTDEARVAQAALDISKQTEGALVAYRQSLKIASTAPLLLKTATDVYEGLKISYQSGLTDYARLSQAAYDLQKADVSVAGARLQLWRSLLTLAVAKGDLAVFMDQIK